MVFSRVWNCLAESKWCHLPMRFLCGWSLLFLREERMCVSLHFYSSGIILSYRIQHGLPSTHSLFLGSNKGCVWAKVSHILKWRHLVIVRIWGGSRFNRPGETRHHLGLFSARSARLLLTQSWQLFCSLYNMNIVSSASSQRQVLILLDIPAVVPRMWISWTSTIKNKRSMEIQRRPKMLEQRSVL